MYDEVYFRKVKTLHYTECKSTIYRFHQRSFLEQVPKFSCLEKNTFTKKSVVYQGFNKVAISPKRELTLDLAEKPPWWKLFFSKV